jgi:hypothetical protein
MRARRNGGKTESEKNLTRKKQQLLLLVFM